MLLKGSLRSIAFHAPLNCANKSSFNLLCCSSETFLLFWEFPSNIIFELLCFFLHPIIRVLPVVAVGPRYPLDSESVVSIAGTSSMQYDTIFYILHNIDNCILLNLFFLIPSCGFSDEALSSRFEGILPMGSWLVFSYMNVRSENKYMEQKKKNRNGYSKKQ